MSSPAHSTHLDGSGPTYPVASFAGYVGRMYPVFTVAAGHDLGLTVPHVAKGPAGKVELRVMGV
jgi:hypothetical protein